MRHKGKVKASGSTLIIVEIEDQQACSDLYLGREVTIDTNVEADPITRATRLEEKAEELETRVGNLEAVHPHGQHGERYSWFGKF